MSKIVLSLLALLLLCGSGNGQVPPPIHFAEPVIDFGIVKHRDTLVAAFPYEVVADTPVILFWPYPLQDKITSFRRRDTILPGTRDTIFYHYTDEFDGYFCKPLKIRFDWSEMPVMLEIRGERQAGPPLEQGPEKGRGAVKLARSSFELGRVNRYEDRVLWLSFTNWSLEPKVIEGVESQWDCLDMEDLPFTLKPGESRSVPLKVDFSRWNLNSNSISIHTKMEVEGEPSIPISLTGYLTNDASRDEIMSGPFLRILPREFSLGEVRKGSDTTLALTFQNEGGADLRVFKIGPYRDTAKGDEVIIVPPSQSQTVEIEVHFEFGMEHYELWDIQSNNPLWRDRNFKIGRTLVETPSLSSSPPKNNPLVRKEPIGTPLEDTTVVTRFPKIKWLETAADLGKVTPDVWQTQYRFVNIGEADLILENVKSSCGCLVPNWRREPVIPGDTGVIVIALDVRKRKGAQNKSITVISNDPAKKVSILRIKLKLEEDAYTRKLNRTRFDSKAGCLKMEESVKSFGRINPNQMGETSFHYFHPGKDLYTLERVISQNNSLQVILPDSLFEPQERDSLIVQIHLAQDAKPGLFNEEFQLYFKENPEPVSLIVAGIIEKPITDQKISHLEFESFRHRMGKVAQGPVLIEFSFQVVGQMPIKIAKVTSELPFFQLNYSHKTLIPGDTGTIRLNLTPDRLGPWGQQLEVFLEGNSEPISLYISGEVVDKLDRWRTR